MSSRGTRLKSDQSSQALQRAAANGGGLNMPSNRRHRGGDGGSHTKFDGGPSVSGQPRQGSVDEDPREQQHQNHFLQGQGFSSTPKATPGGSSSAPSHNHLSTEGNDGSVNGSPMLHARRPSPIMKHQPDNFGPEFKHRTMPARNATPRSTAASGLRGRLKPPRLRLQGTASVAGAGGGQGFQSPRGVSLIVQGTPMRTHTAEREGKGLADSVVQALRVLESQPPPATMAELATFKLKVAEIKEAAADITRKYTLRAAGGDRMEEAKEELVALRRQRLELLDQAEQVVGLGLGIESSRHHTSSTGSSGDRDRDRDKDREREREKEKERGVLLDHLVDKWLDGKSEYSVAKGVNFLDEKKEIKSKVEQIAKELKVLEGDEAMNGYGHNLLLLKDASQAAEYRLRENAHVWVELKKDYDTVFNADAYRRPGIGLLALFGSAAIWFVSMLIRSVFSGIAGMLFN